MKPLIKLYEGTKDRIKQSESDSAPNLEFFICEALDPDSEDFSWEINKYEITSVVQCKDEEFSNCANEELLQDFEIDAKAHAPDGGNPFEPKNCDKEAAGAVTIRPTHQYSNNDDYTEKGLNRENVMFYKITIQVSIAI